MRSVGLLDYGSGNLHSAAQALRAAGADVLVSPDPDALQGRDALVVPGVGAFAACMAGIEAVGGRELVSDWVDSGRPLLGICVGHQVFFTEGTEHGVTSRGLGLFPGSIDPIPARRLPHMGWNTVLVPEGSRLFAGVERERFYFVHSYAALTPPGEGLVTTAVHEGVEFVAAMERGNVASTQFHPEKSSAAGVQLLRNWLAGV